MFKKAGYFLVGLLIVGALAFWIRAQVGGLPKVAIPTVKSLVQGTPTNLTASAANAAGTLRTNIENAEDGYVDLTGMILLDTNGGTSVPYLQYATQKEGVMTKQLIFAGSRGCAANAGDLPCVNADPDAAYPQYPTGTNVRVRGLHRADRILVYQIDVITPAAS